MERHSTFFHFSVTVFMRCNQFIVDVDMNKNYLFIFALKMLRDIRKILPQILGEDLSHIKAHHKTLLFL